MQQLLTSRLFDPQWQEVIVLLAGELDDPTPLLSYLAEENQDDLFRPKLALAARCLPEINVESWQAFSSLRQLGDQITATAMDFWQNLAAHGIEGAAPDLEGSLPALATANRNWGSFPVLTRIATELDSSDMSHQAVLLRYLRQAGPTAGTVRICRRLGGLFLTQEGSLTEAALALRALEPDTKSLNVVLQILLDLADRDDAEVRQDAIRAIGTLGPMAAKPKVVQALRAALKRDTAPTYVAAHALSELRAAAAYGDIRDVFTTAVKVDIRGPVLTQALMSLTPSTEKDSILRMLAEQLASGIRYDEDAARVLSFMGTWADTDYIRQALLNYIATAIAKHDTYGNMALWNAITALGKLGPRASDDSVVSTLLELLQQGDPELRSRTAEALGYQDARAVRKEVVQALLDELQANHPTSRSSAAEALARLRPSEDRRLVVNALLDFVRRLWNQSPFILREAIEALGSYGPEAAKEPDVVKVLLDHLEHYAGPVREMAAWALGELGTAVATEVVKSALCKELSDSELYPRKAAANSLGRFQRNGIRCEVALTQKQ
jgi:HEAT repeat protein